MSKIYVCTNGEYPYQEALCQQESLFQRSISAKLSGESTSHYLLFNIHEPVITLGAHARSTNLLYPPEFLESQGIHLYRTSRGGDVTYHGPGQWTVYPIMDLEELGIGVREYVFRLEEVSIHVLRDYGIDGRRIKGAAGIWVRCDTDFPQKVCAIGIKCRHFVTMHGIAFNVNTDMDYFKLINPCGFTDKGATSLSLLLGHEVEMEEVRRRLLYHFCRIFQRPYTEVSRNILDE